MIEAMPKLLEKTLPSIDVGQANGRHVFGPFVSGFTALPGRRLT